MDKYRTETYKIYIGNYMIDSDSFLHNRIENILNKIKNDGNTILDYEVIPTKDLFVPKLNVFELVVNILDK